MNQAIFNLLLLLLLSGILYVLFSISQAIKECIKKCCGGSGNGSCVITYPPDSIGGSTPNLLSYPNGATVNLGTTQVYPLRADMTSMNCTVKAVIKVSDPSTQLSILLNQHNWFVRGDSQQDLTFFSYGAGVADGNVNIIGTGTGTIEIYENGGSVPVKIINLQL